MEQWDYIVVGAGSAGCVVARRLSDDPAVRVLLIEAGPPAKDFWIGVPAGMARVIGDPRFDWRFMTEPEPALNGRRIPWPRGKVLGGSSTINGMVWTRGNRRDYDHWASLGNPGWSWDEVLPYFRRLEDNVKGPGGLRGAGGPQKIGRSAPAAKAIDAFVAAASQNGIAPQDDLSVCGEEGTGLLQASIDRGVRHSTWDAYLAPVQGRANLTVMTDVQVRRVCLVQRVATGVEVQQAGTVRTLTATREVVLCAGVTNSPHLLMLSGIGEAAQLQAFGIPVVADLPGVGKNLQDHVGVHLKFQMQPGWSFNHAIHGWRKYWEGLRYVTTKTGYLTASATVAAAFVKSSPDMPWADLEIGFRPISFSQSPAGVVSVDDRPAISSNVYRVRPDSRGEVRLKSADPLQPAAFFGNFLTATTDQAATITGVRRIRQFFATAPLASNTVGEMVPGPAVQSDAEILDFIRQYAKSSYHPIGTCRMGQDKHAVVDPALRVRGVEHLRVIDASVMPTPSSGNTNAATIMIGEKGSDLIRADAGR